MVEQSKWLFQQATIDMKSQIASSYHNRRGYYKFEGIGYGESNHHDDYNNNNQDDDSIEAFLIGNERASQLKSEYFQARGIPKKVWSQYSDCQFNQWPSSTINNNNNSGFQRVHSKNSINNNDNDQQSTLMNNRDQLFKSTILKYFDQCSSISLSIVQLISMSLGYKKNDLDHLFSKNDHTLELKHYPPLKSILSQQEQQPQRQYIRMNEHKDLSCLTLLLQNKRVDGLELYDNDSNTWIPAPLIDDCFLVNTGDIIEKLTEGVFPSTLHRVVNNPSTSTQSRYSAAFFYVPNWEKSIDPLSSLSTNNNNNNNNNENQDNIKKKIHSVLGLPITSSPIDHSERFTKKTLGQR
ncbi:hypothetical protein DFA_10529 [Cavenderia fasciculata]|uniref:Fe2OG dioxygenase domain-containing protein n=1 Tax=Cavenderia fasciculata TaxID=261658 RepID=F4QAG8_CACFS|nr:uncharacterized protein DFA_10529 [Cavenderia fasciculata]EGG15687.1 hypothetical protein DFA_10529 [Cavenderia fasciculata]|eukprot:XP_004354429.1 hypothetical protein DFA_10529 [Cavenderia fasciculata]